MSRYRRKDLVKVAITTGGTDNRVVNSTAVANYQPLDTTDNGRTVRGTFRDGSAYETGEYSFNFSTLTLTRSRFIRSSTGSAVNITTSGTFTEAWTTRDAELMGPWDDTYYWEDYAGSESVFLGASDGTSAAQTMMDDIAADIASSGGGKAYSIILRGNILLTGSPVDTTWRNCQLKLPTVTAVAVGSGPSPQAALTIINPHKRYFSPNVTTLINLPVPAGKSGRIISTNTTLTGTSPAVLGGRDNSGSPLGNSFTLLNLFMENIQVETVKNSSMTALNLEYIAAIDLRNVLCVAGDMNLPQYTSAPAGGFGILTPRNANSAWTRGDNVHCIGYRVGVQINEHMTGFWGAWACFYAGQVLAADHPSYITRFMNAHCPNGITSVGGGAHRLDIAQYDVEFIPAGGLSGHPSWQDHTWDVDDAGNFIKGSWRYGLVQANVGGVGSGSLLKNGGSGLTLTSIF